jgi:hypothetical protein
LKPSLTLLKHYRDSPKVSNQTVEKMGSESTLVIDQTTILSLSANFGILLAAYSLSRVLLPAQTSTKLQIIYVWHAYDLLVHFIFEGSYLYNCFFVYVPGASLNNFLSQPLRTYGSFYGSSPTAKLWQEYAKADRRWGESDLTIISLELLTVFGAGPLSTYICYCIQKQDRSMWYWMTIVATAELYGGKGICSLIWCQLANLTKRFHNICPGMAEWISEP